MRQAGAAVVGGAVAALGALILGEYSLGVAAGLVAGVIVGLAVAEAATMAAGGRAATALLPAVAALLVAAAFGALVWAGWIDVRRRNESIGAGAWVGAIAAAATVAVRTRLGTGRSAGSGSPEGSRRTR